MKYNELIYKIKHCEWLFWLEKMKEDFGKKFPGLLKIKFIETRYPRFIDGYLTRKIKKEITNAVGILSWSSDPIKMYKIIEKKVFESLSIQEKFDKIWREKYGKNNN